MSAPIFAVTRIQPPRRAPGWVDRPALQQRLLDAAQHCTVTLVCAAAGYGKTAVLTQLMHELPAEVARVWITADEDEQLPGFLACLCAALEPLNLDWRVSPDALATLAQAEGGLRDVAVALVNALASLEGARGLIVLDDGDRIVDARVFELLQMVIERLPTHWGVVLASRIELPLGLSRLRAAGALAEFRQADLSFGEPEVRALLHSHGLAADGGEQARSLLARTQGWAAGLRLSLCTPRGVAPADERLTQRHLFDFLAAEVLDDMPARLCEFLLRSAVLPELTARRAAAVTGMADAAELMAEIDRRGLFVSVLDADEPTLRLHELFRSFLEDRLRRVRPELLGDLLRRAAEGEPDVSRAVGYLARAGAWPQALATLGRQVPALLAAGAEGTLEPLLALFPAAQYETQPDLWMLRGLCAWPRYDFDSLLDCMQQAVAGYQRAGRERDAALASAHLCAGLDHTGRFEESTRILTRLGELALDDAAMAFIHYGQACDAVVGGRAAEVVPARERMLAALERAPDAALWQQCPLQLLMIGAPGTLAQHRTHADAVLRLAGDQPSTLRAGALHVRALHALFEGQPEAAWSWLAQADEDCRWLGRPRLILTDNRLLHVLLHALAGEREASHAVGCELVDDIRRAATASHRRVHEPAMLFHQARAAWLLQDLPTLRRVAGELAAARHPHEWPSAHGIHGLCDALVALADERLEAAAALLEQLEPTIACHFLNPGVQARTLQAAVYVRQQRLDEAAALLRPLLETEAEEESALMLLAGEPALAALRAADWAGRLGPADLARLDRVIDALQRTRRPAVAAGAAAGAAAGPTVAAAPGTERLTPREEEILALLAAGHSNKLIARDLGLSVHTVKQHVASILGKLGVASRGQAAAHWHRLH